MKRLLLFLLLLLILAVAFETDTPHNPAGNWYQQFLPNIGNRTISDIFFIDSLTGWAVTPFVTQNDTTFVLKTTNGGDNWFIQFTGVGQFVGRKRIMFINANTGFTCGNDHFSGSTKITKTTNGGNNWFSLNDPSTAVYDDMFVLNEDTIWLVSSSNPTGGVFRTTNGGASWQNQLSLGSSNPDRIYMINGRIGFISETNNYTRITINSGQNWSIVLSGGGQGFYNMFFVDSLTGWGTFSNTRKTTDGGFNWVVQTMPDGGNIVAPQIEKLSGLNEDTIWGAGAQILTSIGIRGMINRTTNGGDNWLFQVPDSTYNNNRYYHLDFYNKLNGWAYLTVNRGIHTTTGGDPIWYLGIQQISSNIPKDFTLKQNYPNPFNPRTVIPFSLKKSAYVKLIAYDITGREIQRMVDSKLQAGEYEVDFMGKFTASGVYLYSLIIDGQTIAAKKMLLVK